MLEHPTEVKTVLSFERRSITVEFEDRKINPLTIGVKFFIWLGRKGSNLLA